MRHLGAAGVLGLLGLGFGACGGAGFEVPVARAERARSAVAPAGALREVGAGTRSLASFVSLQAGVIVVEITEGGDESSTALGARVCGDALAARLASLEAHMVMMAQEGIPLECAGAVCTDRPGVEYDPARHFRFEDGPSGPRIAAIHLLDEAAVAPEYVADQRRRARIADAGLSGAPCGATLVP